MKRARFPEEFKQEAVKQVVESGYSVPDVAGRLVEYVMPPRLNAGMTFISRSIMSSNHQSRLTLVRVWPRHQFPR